MKIKVLTDESIKFDNGSYIRYDHCQDCCENNYADFEQLEEIAYEVDFDENLIFEAVQGFGFRFGSERTSMYFVPCYSEQNGWYTSDLDIYYKDKVVTKLACEFIED